MILLLIKVWSQSIKKSSLLEIQFFSVFYLSPLETDSSSIKTLHKIVSYIFLIFYLAILMRNCKEQSSLILKLFKGLNFVM